MTKPDARKQSRLALFERRQEVIRAFEDGVPVMQIVERTGLSWHAVNRAIKLKAGDASSLMPAARGRKRGTGRVLTNEQETEIREFIRKRRPMHYGLKSSLWTRLAVRKLIEQKCDVALSERGVSNYLDRWDLMLTGGRIRPYERCTRETKEWLDLNYENIERQARAENAEICWLNNPKSIRADAWVPVSKRKDSSPEVDRAAKPRRNLTMASAVNNQGRLSWAVYSGSLVPDRQIGFIQALAKDAGRKRLFVIVCDQRKYRSRTVLDWILENRNRIRVFSCPVAPC